MAFFSTPQHQLTLSAELRNVINERKVLTTRSRMKVLSALENASKELIEEKEASLRSKAIQEILTSEASYLNQLEVIMKFFMQPLKNSAIISSDVLMGLFSNIETLYNVNGELLHELKKNPENVAASFVKLAPFFKLYSVYACDYRHALDTLQDLHKKNSAFHKFIEDQETRPEVGMKLTALLIAPIQRIPRYRLLLKEVLAHTAPTQADHGMLLESLQAVEKTADHINRLVWEYENMHRMIQLQKCFCGGLPRIVSRARKLVKEGPLLKVSPQGYKSHKRYCLLFSDIFMYCKLRGSSPLEANSLYCCCILPLAKCHVTEILGKGLFEISCQNITLMFCSATAEEGELWVAALKQAVKQFHECRQTLRKESSSRKPVKWPYVCNMSQDELLEIPAMKKKNPSNEPYCADNEPKDSLYPLRRSLKRKSMTSQVNRCKRYKSGHTESAEPEASYSKEISSTYPTQANPTVTESPGRDVPQWSWRQRFIQIVRCIVTDISQVIQRHVNPPRQCY